MCYSSNLRPGTASKACGKLPDVGVSQHFALSTSFPLSQTSSTSFSDTSCMRRYDNLSCPLKRRPEPAGGPILCGLHHSLVAIQDRSAAAGETSETGGVAHTECDVPCDTYSSIWMQWPATMTYLERVPWKLMGWRPPFQNAKRLYGSAQTNSRSTLSANSQH